MSRLRRFETMYFQQDIEYAASQSSMHLAIISITIQGTKRLHPDV